MNLVQKHIARRQSLIIPKINQNESFIDTGLAMLSDDNNFDGFRTVTKQYFGVGAVPTGSSESVSKKDITVQQRVRTQYLKNLFGMSPCANQAAEKLVTSILSDGWYIVPRNKNKKRNDKRIFQIEDTLEEMGFTDVLKHSLWAWFMFGDVYVYTPTGRGRSSKIVKDLVPLENVYTYFDVDRKFYEKTGIAKIIKYRYEVPPIFSTASTSYKQLVVNYNPEEVIHLSRKTSFNHVGGTAYLEEDQATLILGLRVLNHNLRFFANSTKPPLIVKLGEGSDYKKALEYKKILDTKYKGSNNMWETMVTWGNTDVKELKLPDSTAFFDMLTYVRIQVCGLLGVPPQEIGISDKSGLNNSETAHKDFIKTNVNAKKREIGKFFTRELLRKRMKIDDYEIFLPPMDAISEKQRAETNRVMIESGQMVPDEARESIGKPIYNKPWSKIPYYASQKGVIKIKPLETADDSIEENNGKGNGRDGISDVDDKKDGGRPDLDGRDKEPHQSINSDDST